MKGINYRILAAALLLICVLSIPVSAETTGNTTADIIFRSGTLTLSEIAAFSFGTQTISATAQTYPAWEESVFVDVRDLRGTGEGWKVTALVSKFASESAPTLPGAYLSFTDGAADSTQPQALKPTIQPSIQLECDGAATHQIASAGIGTGLGVWSIQWNGPSENNDLVTLTIPGGVATVGTHSATVTWTLADAP